MLKFWSVAITSVLVFVFWFFVFRCVIVWIDEEEASEIRGMREDVVGKAAERGESDDPIKLREKIVELENELKESRMSNKKLDKDRRNSITQMSQKLYLEMMDNDEKQKTYEKNFNNEIYQLKVEIEYLRNSKLLLVQKTAETINQLREALAKKR